MSNRSVHYIHSTIHKVLQNAVKMGLLVWNPADAVEAPKLQRHEIQTLSESDLHQFLEAAKATPYYSLFFCALFTGMRRSKLLALRWSDVDLLGLQVSVNRTLHVLNNGKLIIKQPKTARSRRLIALTPATAVVLRNHQSMLSDIRQKLSLSPLTEEDLVFCHPETGTPLLPNSVTHAWMVLSRRVGLHNVSLHAARHTHASLMLKQGVHPKVVQERLGHSTISTTLDIYSHVAPGLQQAAVAKFDDIMNGVNKSFERQSEVIL